MEVIVSPKRRFTYGLHLHSLYSTQPIRKQGRKCLYELVKFTSVIRHFGQTRVRKTTKLLVGTRKRLTRAPTKILRLEIKFLLRPKGEAVSLGREIHSQLTKSKKINLQNTRNRAVLQDGSPQPFSVPRGEIAFFSTINAFWRN
jgi:hypothetical protein